MKTLFSWFVIYRGSQLFPIAELSLSKHLQELVLGNYKPVFFKRFLHALMALVMLCCFTQSQAIPISKTKNLRIMTIGDSITAGANVGRGGYRQYLQNLLSASGYSYTFVGKQDSLSPYVAADQTGFSVGMSQPNHEGYPGFRIDQLVNGATYNNYTSLPIQTTLANGNPDVILLMLGTNDVFQHYDPLGGAVFDRNVFAAHAAERLTSLLDAIYTAKPQVMVVLSQISPTAYADADLDAQAYNLYIPQVASRFLTAGKNIVMVNQHTAFDPTVDTTDGTHPTLNGYQKMAAVWYEGLTRPSVEPKSGPALSVAGGTFDTSLNSKRYSLGYTFTTGERNVIVSELGYLNDGYNNTHQVRIYKVNIHPDGAGRGTGTLVPGASASVTTMGSNISTFTYTPIAPITLAPNTTYQIVGTNNGNGFLRNAVSVDYNGIRYGTSTYKDYTDTPDFNPNTASGNDVGNLGPNFKIVAPVAAVNYSGGTYDKSLNNYRYSLGYTFTTAAQLTVSELGYLNDGYNNTHQVRIYKVNPDGSGTPVLGASASVTTTGSDITTFSYVPITPVTLASNTTYQIVGTNNGNGFLRNAVNVSFNGIRYGTSTYKGYPDTPDFNTNTASGNDVGNLGPNFKISP